MTSRLKTISHIHTSLPLSLFDGYFLIHTGQIFFMKNIPIEKAIVVAHANNGVIGYKNTLPWKLPADLKHFKSLTLGHPIIMGRKTYDSIGRPLPGRVTIVITRQQDWHAEGVLIAHSLTQAYEIAEKEACRLGVERMMIVGGAEFYRQALPEVNRIFLTQINLNVDGDAFFPDLDKNAWHTVAREEFDASKEVPLSFAFCELCRS